MFSVRCTSELGYIVPPDDTVYDIFSFSANIVLSYYCLPTLVCHPTAGVSTSSLQVCYSRGCLVAAPSKSDDSENTCRVSSERPCVSPKSLERLLHGERQEVEQEVDGVQLPVFGKGVANTLLGRDGVPVIFYVISHFSASVAGNLWYRGFDDRVAEE